jgi:signal transduction histidine kinase
MIQNLDSFERIIRAKKSNPEQYLYGLITLEKNREDYIGWFGQDLDTIKILAEKLHSRLGIASYHYFAGLKLRRQQVNSACRNLLEAIDYFKVTHDTLGLVKSYYTLILINPIAVKIKGNKIESRGFYFDKIMELSQNSNDMQVKFVRIHAVSFYEKMSKGKQDYKERIGEIEDFLRILDKQPNIQPAYANLYAGVASFYQRHKFPQLSLKYQLLSHKLFMKLTSRVCIKSCLNTATGYYNEKDYTAAEPLLLEGISGIEKLKNNERDNTTLLNLYIILSEIQFIKKDYEKAQDSWNKTIDIHHAIVGSISTSLYQELQTQYEIDQKELDNALLIKKNEMAEMKNQQLEQEVAMNSLLQKNQLMESQNLQYQKDRENRILEQQNQSIVARIMQYKTALYIALGSLVLFSVLMYFLYKSNAQQKQLIRFRDQLFAIIAHDMRTPLTAFKGFSEGVSFLMKKGEYQNIHILSQSIDQLIFNTDLLLDNLLNWYALQSTNTKTHKSSFAVYELAKESADLYEAVAKNRQSSIEIAIPDTLMLYANRNALLLILRNLIDNAVKHGKSKKIVIKAGLDANNVVIEVINSETTILNTKLVALQEQMQQSSVVIQEGRGLGLYLVAYFVKQHNGQVSIESSEQDGTRFKVTMPVS